jgi:hypothetical protein
MEANGRFPLDNTCFYNAADHVANMNKVIIGSHANCKQNTMMV